MAKDLEIYLEKRFRYDNFPKYYKYFELWASNLTEEQLFYFEQDRIKELSK